MLYFQNIINTHLSRDCDWILPHPRGVPWPLDCRICLSFSPLSSSPVNISLFLYTGIQTDTQRIIHSHIHRTISIIIVIAIHACCLQLENCKKHYRCLAREYWAHLKKNPKKPETLQNGGMKNFYVRKQIFYLLTLLPHKWLKHIFGLLQWLPVCVYWSCAKILNHK